MRFIVWFFWRTDGFLKGNMILFTVLNIIFIFLNFKLFITNKVHRMYFIYEEENNFFVVLFHSIELYSYCRCTWMHECSWLSHIPIFMYACIHCPCIQLLHLYTSVTVPNCPYTLQFLFLVDPIPSNQDQPIYMKRPNIDYFKFIYIS